MSDTREIAAAKRMLEDQATELPNWARQLLDYIAKVERERDSVAPYAELLRRELEDCCTRMDRCKGILRADRQAPEGWNVLDTKHARAALAKNPTEKPVPASSDPRGTRLDESGQASEAPGPSCHETRQQEECGCSMHCYNFKSSSEQVCKGLPVLAGCAHSDTRSDGADAQECTACGAWRRRYPVMPNGPTDWGPWLRHQSCTKSIQGWLDAFDRWLEQYDPEAFAALRGPGLTPRHVDSLRAAFAAGSEFVACTKQEGE